MKTVTFDESIYKLVPVDPDDAMIDAAIAGVPAEMYRVDAMYAIAAAVAAVPDTLPGVVLHSGEAQSVEGWDQFRHVLETLIKWHQHGAGMFPQASEEHCEDIAAIRRILTDVDFYYGRQNQKCPMLFTHPPAQPDVIKTLRNALEKLARLGNGDCYGNSTGNCIAIAALQATDGTEPAQPSLPTDISAQLREYASNPGYSHGDYADVMRLAADECERFYGGMMAWKQTAETKDRKLSEEMAARVNERVAARLAELPPAQPDTAVSDMCMLTDDFGCAVRKAQTAEIARLRAQLAAQAGQEPYGYVVENHPRFYANKADADEAYLYITNTGSADSLGSARRCKLIDLFIIPPAPANSLAIAQAALAAAIDIVTDADIGDEIFIENAVAAIRTIDPQTILDGMSK